MRVTEPAFRFGAVKTWAHSLASENTGRENREIVFDRLAQVKGSAEASRSGLGLGLFISRELVLRHGGRIWVESQLGHGSTFYRG